MARIYHYDHGGHYTHETEAQLDPVGGDLLVPAHATLTAPPAKVADQVARYDESQDSWRLVADYRGRRYWAAAQELMEITEAGVLPPAGTTELTAGQELIQVGAAWRLRTAATELAAAQYIRIQVLQAQADAEINSGFESSALGAKHRYDSEQHNIDWIQAAVLSGAAAKITCDDLKNTATSKTPREHTAAQCKTVLTDGMAKLLARKTKFRNLRGQVNAATDIAAVEAIQWQSTPTA